jgi:hypothetical protein
MVRQAHHELRKSQLRRLRIFFIYLIGKMLSDYSYCTCRGNGRRPVKSGSKVLLTGGAFGFSLGVISVVL